MTQEAERGFWIDRMRRDDLAEVAIVEALSFSLPWTEEMFAQELDRPEVSTILVARAGTRSGQPAIAGYICLLVVEDELHINNLATHPGWRRRGIAEALLVAALDRGRSCGARRALLEVRASNGAAQRLYQRHGFAAVGVRRRYYSHPIEDAILMALEGI
ncbi:MAG: ribosomal protein S18-alanine N-acetyltransferase [Candidatus Methylomirabilota bacterium]